MVKGQTQSRKIFYVEKVAFLRSMFEAALKARGAEIYTIDTMVNNFYLLEDLKPELIIFDVQTVGDSLGAILTYQAEAVLIATGDESDRAQVEGKVAHFMPKPIEAHKLGEFILSFLD